MKRLLHVLFLIFTFILFLVLGIANNAIAQNFCVDTAEELSNALAIAADNDQADVVQIEQGYYIGNFVYEHNGLYIDMVEDISIIGGDETSFFYINYSTKQNPN